MGRLIDADALTISVLKKAIDDAFLNGNTDMHRLLIQVIAHQPTIDAVPVIRCKDCKYYEVAELNNDGTPDKRCKPSICANGWYEYAVERDPNWFCADAERKEDSDGDRLQASQSASERR